MARVGRSATFARLLPSTGLVDLSGANKTVGDSFDAAFRQLKRAGQRDEYVYRAALTRKILLGKHSLKTACMLSEFRAGACKADLVILNGTATVYEIKSERDSLDRLAHQVENYKKVFASVNIVASPNHVERILERMPEDVGVICLSSRFQLSSQRTAATKPEQVCPQTVFESLRSDEAQRVLKTLGQRIPDVPNTQLHSKMRSIFARQEPAAVHRAMVATLKDTRSLSPLGDLVDRLPSSLHAAALSIRLKPKEHQRVVAAVNTSLDRAMRWS
ncbi:sce7726 family protein [Salinisphaera sp. PC39]|uniref:sce7726 family protein n=1 Tax=Salinisphaera sp. PC39 TaxID=1304156 RepID=UPI00333FD545